MTRSKHTVAMEVKYGRFIFRIEDWKPSYSFSTNTTQFNRGAYWEHTSLALTDTCISPRKHEGRKGILNIIGDREYIHPLTTHEDDGKKRLGVGTLTMRGQETSYLGSLPWDAMMGIMPLLCSNAFRFIRLDGDTLYRGRARIRTISFEHEVDPEDLD